MPRLNRDTPATDAVPTETPPSTPSPFDPKIYPVRVATALQALAAAVLGVLAVFHIWTPTQEQYTAMMALYAALLPFFGSFVASKVTPVAKLEAEKQP